MNPFFTDRSERGRLRLTGRDRQSFLQGMVTNDVARLTPGESCYAFLLDATGHVLADVTVRCLDDALLLDLEPGLAPFVAETLDRYLIMEKCRIADVTDETAQIFVGGDFAFPASMTAWTTTLIPGPGHDIYVPRDERDAVIAALGLPEKTTDALDALQIEAGVPRFGVDIDPKVLAPETGQQARAISYRKGCYIGQEIVARIDARGHTNRTLIGFLPETVPDADAPVVVEEREVGRVTSAVVSPTLGRPIALGYIRREHADPGTAVSIAGQPAVVAALPFVSGEDQ